jgi:hypothetical protein
LKAYKDQDLTTTWKWISKLFKKRQQLDATFDWIKDKSFSDDIEAPISIKQEEQ